jgi:hypothetical protein
MDPGGTMYNNMLEWQLAKFVQDFTFLLEFVITFLRSVCELFQSEQAISVLRLISNAIAVV